MSREERYGSSKINITELLGKHKKPSKIKSLDIAPKATETSKAPAQHEIRSLSFNEYVAIASMLFASIILFLTSLPKIIHNLTTDFQPLSFLLNTFYLALALGTLAGALLLLKKETQLEHIADETFDEVIYQRLEPVLRDISEFQVDLEEVKTQLHLINLNFEKLQSKKEAVAARPDYNYIKYIILVNVTLAAFLFMLTYPLSYIPYAVTLIYILWWAVLTAENRLWSIDEAWMWIFIPIIILPIYTIVMSAYLLDYQLFGSLFLGLTIYVIAYYLWTAYLVKGTLPPEIDEAIREIKKQLETQKQKTAKPQRTPMKQLLPHVTLNINTQALKNTLVASACILFAIVWFGYALEHQLIGEANWQTLGIKNFHWQSTYSYILSLTGILLLAITVAIARGKHQ
jgi:hypothetical protein